LSSAFRTACHEASLHVHRHRHEAHPHVRAGCCHRRCRPQPGIDTNPQNISVPAGYSTQNGPTKEAPTTTTTPTTATTPTKAPTTAADHREGAADSDPDAVGRAGSCREEDSDSDYDSEDDPTSVGHDDGAPGTEQDFVDIIHQHIGFVPVTTAGKLQSWVCQIFDMRALFGFHQGKQRGAIQKDDATRHFTGITSAVQNAISAICGARFLNFFLNLNLRKKAAVTRTNQSGKQVRVRDTSVHVDKAGVAAANARGIYQVAEADGSVTFHCKAWTYSVQIPAGYMLIADMDIMIENQWRIKHSHGSADATKYDKDFTGKQQVV
jgi:hypothetical protein